MNLRVTTHAGVWAATNDDGIRLMWDHGFMTPDVTYVHAASLSEDSYQRIAATGGSVSVSSESELNAGQGYPPTWQLRKHGIPVSLSMDSSMWWSADLFSAMRSTLPAPTGPANTWQPTARDETVLHNHLRAEDVVGWATLGGAKALGLELTDREHRSPRQEGGPGPDQERPVARHVPPHPPLRTRWSSRPDAATCTPCWSTAAW